MDPNPRYTFTHFMLPVFALLNPTKFHADITGRDAQNYLSRLWEGLGHRMGTNLPHYKFRVEAQIMEPPHELYIIHMPPPEEVTEAIYLGVYYMLSAVGQIDEVRYFTLEHSFDELAIFCEWVGNPLTDGRHLNYGRLHNAQMETFVQAIREKTLS